MINESKNTTIKNKMAEKYTTNLFILGEISFTFPKSLQCYMDLFKLIFDNLTVIKLNLAQLMLQDF